jgi:predicted deacylase
MPRQSIPLKLAESTRVVGRELAGDRPGPTLAVLGGVHGDEPEGVVASRRLISLLSELPFGGTVLLVPVCCPPAYEAGTRCSPIDGANLARCFPGRADGSPSEQLARALNDDVIARADMLIDLHSAGRDHAMPLFAGALASATPHGSASAAAAIAFGAPITWLHDAVGPGRSISAADALGIPSLYVESGGTGRLHGSDIDAYVDGVLRVMEHVGMLAPDVDRPAPHSSKVLRGGAGDLDHGAVSPLDGWCVPRVAPGQDVSAHEPLAEVIDENASGGRLVRAPHAGTVMLIRHRADVRTGELIAMLGPPTSSPEGPGHAPR